MIVMGVDTRMILRAGRGGPVARPADVPGRVGEVEWGEDIVSEGLDGSLEVSEQYVFSGPQR